MVLAFLLSASASRADGNPLPFTFKRVGGEYRLGLGPQQYYYFGFQHTVDLNQPYNTLKMALGVPGPVFGYTPGVGETQAFFRAEAIDVWSPRDSDGDGIDDLWELQNGLDPLNPADALLPNAHDPGKTNLQYYRDHFGLVRVTEFYSTETSVYNHAFSISTEVSVFNNGVNGFSIEALSQETSVFNFGPPAPAIQALSQETSVFNYGPPSPSIQAISREVSVLNNPS